MNDQATSDNVAFNPGLPIGTRFEHHGVTFELGSVLRKDSNAIVYEARNVLTGYCEHILKLYRRKFSDEELAQTWESRRQCATIVGESFLAGGFFQMGEWTVLLQRRSFEATSSTRRILPANHRAGNFEQEWDEIAKLCDSADFAQALQRCEAGLERSPDNLTFLRAKGIALLGMGNTRAANEVLDLCSQRVPDDADFYAAVIRQCTALGQPIWARKWAEVGINCGVNPRLIYKTWFEAELQFEHVPLARMCLRQLRLLDEPEDSFEQLGMRLDDLQERLIGCAKDVDEAFAFLERRQLEKASEIADRLLRAYPHHVPAMRLAAVWAIEKERWPEALFHLRRALTHEPLGDPDVPRLLGHVYRKLGKFEHAAIMQAVVKQLRNDAREFVMGRGENLQ